MGIKLNLGKSAFDIIKENATQLRIEKKEQDKIRSFKDAYIQKEELGQGFHATVFKCYKRKFNDVTIEDSDDE